MTLAARFRLAALALAGVAWVACGPQVTAEADPQELFDELEQSVDAFCEHVDECSAWLNAQDLADKQYKFTMGDCFITLHSSMQRIAEGDRCTDPETMSMLLDCVSAIECPSFSMHVEVCEAEYLAAEDALCNPF
jgi:hypothetical protein